ncbi:MAG: hypothetical protein ACYDEN_00815 [Acidimicrobiales bacterium]
MDIMAYINDTRVGTAQVLTFAFPIGVLGGVLVWGFFERPGGHRRGRRRRDQSRPNHGRREGTGGSVL